MPKRLLDVGNCNADHGSLRHLCSAIGAEIVRAHSTAAALDLLKSETFHLVAVNRILDRDGTAGLELIQAMQNDRDLQHVPVMLISNYADAQQAAATAGAVPGFGKSHMFAPETKALLEQYLK